MEALARWLAVHRCKRWLLALSGGPDSMALLHLLGRIPAPRPPILALHVHHGLQPQADDWAAFCLQQCQRLQLPCEILHVRVRVAGRGLEDAARRARYEALRARMQPGDALLLAHHADDQAETLLLNLFRGAGLDGLTAMPAARPFPPGLLLRPLLGMSRQSLLQWLESQNIPWLHDPSNDDPRLRRNWLRHQLLPQIERHWPGIHQRLARTARQLQQARESLDQNSRTQLDRLALPGFSQALDRMRLCQLPPIDQARLLRLWLHRAAGGFPSEKKLEEIRRAACSDLRRHTISWQGMEIHCWRNGLHVLPVQTIPPTWQRDWNGLAPLALPCGCSLELKTATPTPAGHWQVRLRRGGERLRLPGRRHHHSLKKLLQAASLPPWERRCLPLLLSQEGEILAAGDLWFSEEFTRWLDRHRATLYWHRPWRGRTMPAPRREKDR